MIETSLAINFNSEHKSEFDSQSALFDDDEKMEKVWKSEYALQDLLGDKEFKSYDELKGRLDKVLGLNGEVIRPKTTVETIKEEQRSAPKVDEEDTFREPAIHETEDDDLSYFSKLAEED